MLAFFEQFNWEEMVVLKDLALGSMPFLVRIIMERIQEIMIDQKNQATNWQGLILDGKHLMHLIAFYGQIVGEDEDKFLPNCLMFQYGAEGWLKLDDSTSRIFAEYADLTSYWWTNDPRTRNISYGHHIYKDGYRYRGRPIGHWADQDSQILSFGGLFLHG